MGEGAEVIGGVGGVAARTDDMRWHAGHLDRTAEQLRESAWSAGRASEPDLLLRTAAFAPATAAMAQASVLDAGVRVGTLAARVELSAQRLLLTAVAVLAADRWPRAARQRVTEVLSPATLALAVGGGTAAGLAGVLEGGVDSAIEATPWVEGGSDEGVAGRMLDEAMQNWAGLVQTAPWLVDGVVHGSARTADALLASNRHTAPLSARINGREDLVTELLAIAPAFGALVDTPVRATALSGPHPAAGPRSLKDIVVEQQALMDRARPDSQASRLRLIQTQSSDGATSWIVLVPGTQEWPLRPQGDPSDLTTNAHLSATGDAAVLDAIDDAMRLAGVAPDDPVMLAGHSQGGITAAAFSRQADQRGYNVTHVFTQGSPIQNLPPPPDVHGLSIEHTDDLVTRVDSGPNADLPNHTTVMVDSGAAVTTNIIRPHGLDRYERTVFDAVASGHPSVTAFDAEVTELFLSGPVVNHEFETVRVHGDD